MLDVISRSPNDMQPVLDAVVRECGAAVRGIRRCDLQVGRETYFGRLPSMARIPTSAIALRSCRSAETG